MRGGGLLFLALAALLHGNMADAQDRTANTFARVIAEDPRFDAIGRLNLSGKGFCTATLIASSLALTAAHCLTDKRTGKPVPPEDLHFVAGFRKGKYRAHRRGRTVSIHESFAPGKATLANMRHDIALVVLASPIPASVVRPIPLDGETGNPRLTVPLTLVSYARDRAYLPSVERGCVVRRVDGRLLFTDCSTTFGGSGAPALVTRDGGLHVLGVVSGVATMDGLRRTVVIRAREAAED